MIITILKLNGKLFYILSFSEKCEINYIAHEMKIHVKYINFLDTK